MAIHEYLWVAPSDVRDGDERIEGEAAEASRGIYADIAEALLLADDLSEACGRKLPDEEEARLLRKMRAFGPSDERTVFVRRRVA